MLRNCIKENVFASVNYDFLIMRMKDLPVNEDNPAVIPPNNPVKTTSNNGLSCFKTKMDIL